MPEMVIDSIRVSLMNYQRVVILRVKDSDRYLPIWIGPNEADSITLKLQEVSVPRPLTHDLLESIITSLGASVIRVVVCDLSNDTFFANIVLQVSGTEMEIDCRPSDAIALAIRTEAPIFVEDFVLDRAAVQMDMETGKPVKQEDDELGKPVPLNEEELKSLSAFTDFIDTLNLEDLGTQDRPGSSNPK